MSYFIAIQFFIFALAILIATKAFQAVKKYVSKGRLLNQLEDRHDGLRKARRELLQHFYWAESNNERSTADALEKQIVQVDKELDEIAEQYHLIKKGKEVPLKSL